MNRTVKSEQAVDLPVNPDPAPLAVRMSKVRKQYIKDKETSPIMTLPGVLCKLAGFRIGDVVLVEAYSDHRMVIRKVGDGI